MRQRLRLWEIEVPFRRPLRTAQGDLTVRHSVILALDSNDSTGWAEAPAFPSGRFGTAADAFDDLSDPAGWVGDTPNVPIASAALQGARADSLARSVHIPLHRHLGSSGSPVVARHPIGVSDPVFAEREATWLQTHGITAAKVKVAPGHDVDVVRAFRAAIPDLDIGVDANGSYDDPDDPALTALDELDVSFVEQPFAAHDLAAHTILRSRTRMSVCLDESITNIADVRQVIALGAADVVAIKLNRLGLEALTEILRLCRSAGVGVQLGGTFDTSIGRRHLLAAAGLPGIVDAAVGPPSAYLETELAPYPQLVRGMVEPDPSPGIGIDPDTELLDDIALRSSIVAVE